MDLQKKCEQFLEQIKDKPNTAEVINNAIRATGYTAEMKPYFLAYANVYGADIKNGLAELDTAGEAARQEKALQETAAVIAEQSGTLKTETDTEKQKELIENIRRLTASLGTATRGKRRIYTVADYLAECLNYDPSKDFTPALFGGLAFPDGDTSYIGARTNRGKTTLMINLAREALYGKQPRKTIFISLEMSHKQIMNKLVLSTSFEMGISTDISENNRKALMSMNPKRDIYTVWKRGNFPETGSEIFHNLVTAALKKITVAEKEGRFVFYDGRGATEEEIINFMIAHGERGAVILLDHIQRMPPKTGSDTDSFRRIQAISNDVVNAGAATNAVIIAGSQFKRGGGMDALGDVFTDESFREAGDIEQDAYNAIGIGWKADKQGRFYEILKTREDNRQGEIYDLDFTAVYSFMEHGKRNYRPENGEKKTTPNPNKTSRKPIIASSINLI